MGIFDIDFDNQKKNHLKSFFSKIFNNFVT